MRRQLVAGLWTALVLALGLASLPCACADPSLNAWNQLMINQLRAGYSAFRTSRAIAGMHLAQWNAIKAILAQQGLTPDSPNLNVPSLLPALRSGAAAAAKKVLNDPGGGFGSQNASWISAVDALYTSQVDTNQTTAIAAGNTAGQVVITMRLNDGSLATAANWTGNSTTCGAWRPTPPGNQPGMMPQWRFVTPWALETPSQFRLPPPPSYQNSTIYREAYQEVYLLGRNVSAARTPEETMIGDFWHLNVQEYTNELTRLLTADYDIVESARFLVTNAIAFADMQIAGWDTKYWYNSWRPITAIRLGNCVNDLNFPKDETWTPLLVTPNHPEYMAGHAATSAAVLEALRFLNGGDIIPSTTITNYMMPAMGGRTFTSLTAMANEIARSRVLAGAHFSFSTKAAQTMGRQLGAYVVKYLGTGGCGPGNYVWGGACLPCPMDTYWPYTNFTDACTACAAGLTSPMGASACDALLTLAFRANGREYAGEANGGDGGMMMPMGAAAASSASASVSASVSVASSSTSSTRLTRKGKGVIQLVQRNPTGVPSGELAVVTLTLPQGVKYTGTARIVPPLTSKARKQKRSAEGNKPAVNGQTLTWRYAPLAANQERVFTIKVSVQETTASWLSFRASTYYLTAAGAAGGSMDGMMMGGGGGGGMSMMYGLTDLTFNVPIN